MLDSILRQQGDKRKASALDWDKKNEVLRSNPVSVARMFDHRFHNFMNNVIMSPAGPIGKVVDHFYRVEFQQRGSPHTHCLFWVQDAPRLDQECDEEVADFIDNYVTCKLPDSKADPELHEKVSSVQMHSKTHSKSCKKKNTVCRFNFPRPPSKRTFIARPSDDTVTSCPSPTHEDLEEIVSKQLPRAENKKKWAQDLLKTYWKALTAKDASYENINALFAEMQIDQDEFEAAYAELNKKHSIVLKRGVKDMWINQYNEDLLRCWNGNIDIQYVTDAYACVVYIVSYITKAEREMGTLLAQTHREAYAEGNKDAKEVMQTVGRTYMNSRDVCAQEAVYRGASGLHLNEKSRFVQHLGTGDDQIRISRPLVQLDVGDKTANISMTSFNDRYMGRPVTDDFKDMCFATFGSDYVILYGNQGKGEKHINPVLKLQNGLGSIQKRSRSKAIIKYPRFSETKYPEKHYRSMLELFVPHRQITDLMPEPYKLYESYYKNGKIIVNGKNTFVRDIVKQNRTLYEKDIDALTQAEHDIHENGIYEDAWAQMCPEAEKERFECLEELKKRNLDDDNDENDANENIPELRTNAAAAFNIERNQDYWMSKAFALPKLQSMNDDQTAIFYKVRRWCIEKTQDSNMHPFQIFLTGGAGAGKSHLIKCIYYEATRIFSRSQANPDDISVMLTAPTGVAAFNINGSTLHSALGITF
jgi:hypothetical protein